MNIKTNMLSKRFETEENFCAIVLYAYEVQELEMLIYGGRNQKVVSSGSRRIFFNVYLFWRGEEEAEKEADTESEAGSRLRADSTEPDTGFKFMNNEIMT